MFPYNKLDTAYGKCFEGEPFVVRTKMNINRKTFVVAASFNNEKSNLVNDSQLSKEMQKPQNFSPSKDLLYTVYKQYRITITVLTWQQCYHDNSVTMTCNTYITAIRRVPTIACNFTNFLHHLESTCVKCRHKNIMYVHKFLHCSISQIQLMYVHTP